MEDGIYNNIMFLLKNLQLKGLEIKNFNIKLKYLNALDKFATDLIVHTKKMDEKFLQLNSAFARKIYEKGKFLCAQS